VSSRRDLNAHSVYSGSKIGGLDCVSIRGTARTPFRLATRATSARHVGSVLRGCFTIVQRP
jgi:hypothetical protein